MESSMSQATANEIEAHKRTFDQVHDMWIKPELARRRAAGQLADSFVIKSCLIRMPKDKAPIIDFNDEIMWEFQAEVSPAIHSAGDPILLHNIKRITGVVPPKVD